MNAISWMDERSTEECAQLEKQFPPELCEAVTGQMAVLPTWPATKIAWLRKRRPEVYENAVTYMLLKDYVVYYLTGVKLSDMSIATFSFYFDIYNKCYWKAMLDAIGISESQLPKLCEPCTVAGNLLPRISEKLGLDGTTRVNVGTLDHFAGMIGTGNITPGGITLSTGTVMAIATMCSTPAPKSCGCAMHYGFLPDTHVMLPVAESGGVSLEWFRRSCMNVGYDVMNETLAKRGPNELLFLPYLVGTNAPEFDAEANGVFWGLRQEHDAIDMAGAVMEGVSFVLRKNCEHIAAKGVKLERIIATGGGAKSPIWCQMQADITGLPVSIPKEKEAACLGAALIAAVSDERFASYEEAVHTCVELLYSYEPHPSDRLERKYRRFCALYQAALEIGRI
jgi:xylulokinase